MGMKKRIYYSSSMIWICCWEIQRKFPDSSKRFRRRKTKEIRFVFLQNEGSSMKIKIKIRKNKKKKEKKQNETKEKKKKKKRKKNETFFHQDSKKKDPRAPSGLE